jgi:hypothetical protein
MTRVLTQILAGAATLAIPLMTLADTQQAGTEIQVAQSTTDKRLQGVQPVTPPAPNTRPIGPTVRPYGSTGDDDWRRNPAPPPQPSINRPSPLYPIAPPDQGMPLVPGGG